MRSTIQRREFTACLIFANAIWMVQAGCRAKSNLPGPSGTVQGTASYRGKPIPVGSAIVMVHKTEGLFGIGITDEQGSFSIKMLDATDVLVGEYTVNIKPPGEPGENVVVYTKATVPAAWNEIPEKYWSPTTSQESFTVKEGHNTYTLVLKE